MSKRWIIWLLIGQFFLSIGFSQSYQQQDRLLDLTGHPKTAGSLFLDSGLRVFIFLDPECPLCQNYSILLNQLNKRYAPSAEFVGIIPGSRVKVSAIEDFRKKYHISFRLYRDISIQFSRKLGATVTPEVIVMKNGKIIYMGLIDDGMVDLGIKRASVRHKFLNDALECNLSTEVLVIPFTRPIGCVINNF
jgi:hypothetical protein